MSNLPCEKTAAEPVPKPLYLREMQVDLYSVCSIKLATITIQRSCSKQPLNKKII